MSAEEFATAWSSTTFWVRIGIRFDGWGRIAANNPNLLTLSSKEVGNRYWQIRERVMAGEDFRQAVILEAVAAKL